MRFFVFVFVLVAVFLAQSEALAHHSAASFDLSKTFALKGTLTRVDWRNPHVVLTVTTVGEGVAPDTWELESGAPSWFRGRNLAKADLDAAIGQHVCIAAVRARDGTRYAYLYELTFADGRRWELR